MSTEHGDWIQEYCRTLIVVVDSGLDPLEISFNKEEIVWQKIEYDGRYFYSWGWKHKYFTKARQKRMKATSLHVFFQKSRQ